MAGVFIKLLNMSITAGWIVLAVAALRMVFRKAPKSLTCALWALVGIRLVCPFSFESILSIIPSSQTVPPVGNASQSQVITGSIPTGSTETAAEAASGGFGLSAAEILSIVWVIGIATMLIYFAVSYIRIYKNVRASIKIQDNIYICDDISTPFILGIIRPKIYLPSAIAKNQIGCVVAHEKAHIKRHDNLWKPLGFLMLSVYWFNPLMWLAYILLCRDIELACDEKVIKKMETEDKKAYSEVLFEFSAPKRMVMACPVAFAEVGVKTRIKSVLNYKKPAFWVIIAACVAVTVTAVCLMTNPVEPKTLNENLESFISDTIIRRNSREPETGSMMDFACESHVVLNTRKQGNATEVYCIAAYFEYNGDYVRNGFNVYDDSYSHGESGGITPTIISVIRNDYGGYDLIDYWEAGNGSAYAESIKLRFPIGTWKDAIGTTYNEQLVENCKKQACEYFKVPYNYEPATFEGTTTAVTTVDEKFSTVSLGNGLGLTIKQKKENSLACLQFDITTDKRVFYLAEISARYSPITDCFEDEFSNSYLIHKETKEKVHPLDDPPSDTEPWSLYFDIGDSELSDYNLHYEVSAFLDYTDKFLIDFTWDDNGIVTFDKSVFSLPNGCFFRIKSASVRDDETVRQFVDGEPRNKSIDIEYETSDGLAGLSVYIKKAHFTGVPLGMIEEKDNNIFTFDHAVLADERSITVSFESFIYRPLFTGEIEF